MNIEQQYVNLVREILENGTPKQPTRMENGQAVKVENGTIGIPHTMIQHDMSEGFPLMTHKKMYHRGIFVELEGFIKGVSSKKWYQDRQTQIWNAWCNKQSDEYNSYLHEGKTSKHAAELTDDLGPIYGVQWRKFGQQYGYIQKEQYPSYDYNNGEFDIKVKKHPNGLEKGFDQLKYIADTLRSNPYDRRMVCSAWNPNQFSIMALPPCHVLTNIVVYGDTLNLCWFQRSVDVPIGLCYNIASYATLLLLLCKHTEGYTNLKPGKLTGYLGDCHIYENQIDGAKEVLKRELKPLPTLSLTHSGDLFDWTYKDVQLEGYTPGDKISFGEITV